MDQEKCSRMPHQINFVFFAFLLLIWPSSLMASGSREFLIESLEKVESMQSFFEQKNADRMKDSREKLLFQNPIYFVWRSVRLSLN